MKKVTTTGKTVEDALLLALHKLQVSREQVKYAVLNEPSRGFLGFFGARDAEVEVEVIQNPVQLTENFIRDVLNAMQISNVQIDMDSADDHTYKFLLHGDELGVLIGKRGHTLDSLQYLVNLVANKQSDKFIRVTLDAENYRDRRKESLERLASRLAQRAVQTRKEVVLEPMSSQERKIIHSFLQTHPLVTTISMGDEPQRKVVIRPRKR
ncbi:MAG: protein jag [Bacilli bacterium]|nr:protein jag [Bacilli bacterium]